MYSGFREKKPISSQTQTTLYPHKPRMFGPGLGCILGFGRKILHHSLHQSKCPQPGCLFFFSLVMQTKPGHWQVLKMSCFWRIWHSECSGLGGYTVNQIIARYVSYYSRNCNCWNVSDTLIFVYLSFCISILCCLYLYSEQVGDHHPQTFWFLILTPVNIKDQMAMLRKLVEELGILVRHQVSWGFVYCLLSE